jgi:hypothetical protein
VNCSQRKGTWPVCVAKSDCCRGDCTIKQRRAEREHARHVEAHAAARHKVTMGDTLSPDVSSAHLHD